MPELLTNVLAEHTYDPVRPWNVHAQSFLAPETLSGPDFDYGPEVC